MMLINGVAAQNISASDRGLAYGDGVFRTLPAIHGKPLHWDLHYAKLAADCAAIKLPCPEPSLLYGEITVVAQSEPRCALKIIVTRGSGPRGYAPPQNPEITRIVMCAPWSGTAPLNPITLHLCRLRLAHQPVLAGIKHLNRLENVLARDEWNDPNIAEGLLRDQDDNVIGGTMSNLFIVERGMLVTPDLSHCGVAGVTRTRVLTAAAEHQVPCRVEPMALARVLAADEVFVVNSLIGVWPVARLENTSWPHGVLTAQVGNWLAQ